MPYWRVRFFSCAPARSGSTESIPRVEAVDQFSAPPSQPPTGANTVEMELVRKLPLADDAPRTSLASGSGERLDQRFSGQTGALRVAL